MFPATLLINFGTDVTTVANRVGHAQISTTLNFYAHAISSADKVWIRIPVIPGVNDGKDDMLRIKKYLSSYKPKKIELLPYHRMGENKYDALNMVATSFDVPDNLLDLKSTIQ